MRDDPMTQEEINAARKWSGLGDEVPNEKIAEMTQGTLWLHNKRYNEKLESLKTALSAAIKKELAELRAKMVSGK